MAATQWRRQTPSTVFKASAVLAWRKCYADPLGVLEPCGLEPFDRLRLSRRQVMGFTSILRNIKQLPLRRLRVIAETCWRAHTQQFEIALTIISIAEQLSGQTFSVMRAALAFEHWQDRSAGDRVFVRFARQGDARQIKECRRQIIHSRHAPFYALTTQCLGQLNDRRHTDSAFGRGALEQVKRRGTDFRPAQSIVDLRAALAQIGQAVIGVRAGWIKLRVVFRRRAVVGHEHDHACCRTGRFGAGSR